MALLDSHPEVWTRRRERPLQVVPFRSDRQMSLADWEFSEVGRSSAFPHGWWMLPGLAATILLGSWLVASLV